MLSRFHVRASSLLGKRARLFSEKARAMSTFYRRTHEWIKMENEGTCTVGVTDYAQKALGEVVFVELPSEGDVVSVGEPFASVESVKAASDVYGPVSGVVEATNPDLSA